MPALSRPAAVDAPDVDVVEVEAVLADRDEVLGAEGRGGVLLARADREGTEEPPLGVE